MQYVTTCKHELFQHLHKTLFYVLRSFFDVVSLISTYGNFLWSFVYVIIPCVGAGITTLMSFSDGLDPYFFRRKMERTRSMKEELDKDVFIFRQNRYFSFVDNIIKVLFPICTLIWRVNNYVCRQAKVYLGETKVLKIL